MTAVSLISESDDDEAFLRQLIFPEEDRHRFTATPWRGGYRWFRSPNIVCLEHYRADKTKTAPKLKAS
jgi:hypothetical protein